MKETVTRRAAFSISASIKYFIAVRRNTKYEAVRQTALRERHAAEDCSR